MKKLLLVVALVGCKGSVDVPEDPNAPKCGDVAKHLVELAKRDKKTSVSEDDHVARCKETYTPNRRRCYVTASSSSGLVKCDREALIASGVDMGGPDCDEIWNHYGEVLRPDASTSRTLRDTIADRCALMTKPQKECWMKAASEQAMNACAPPSK